MRGSIHPDEMQDILEGILEGIDIVPFFTKVITEKEKHVKTEMLLHGFLKIKPAADFNAQTSTAWPPIRIRFYSCDATDIPGNYLGETEVGPDGTYYILFSETPPKKAASPAQRAQKVTAIFLQFTDEVWKEITEKKNAIVYTEQENSDEGMLEVSTRARASVFKVEATLGSPDAQVFEIPEESSVAMRPDSKGLPSTGKGFQFLHIGLLPMGDPNIADGYATMPSPPFALKRQPFGGTLRISGQFDGGVATYSLAAAKCDSQGAAGEFFPVTDPLTDQIWNDNTQRWIQKPRGPDAQGRYLNAYAIGAERWCEPDLKVCWVTSRIPDGSYVLRIKPYNSSGNEIGASYLSPVLRICNTPPTVLFDPKSTDDCPIDECGWAKFIKDNRIITFAMTIAHPQGYLAKGSLSGTRGPANAPAGTTVQIPRPASPDHWPNNELEPFTVMAPRKCPTMAYSFLLQVYGSPTDCRSQYLYAVNKRINLIVTEKEPKT